MLFTTCIRARNRIISSTSKLFLLQLLILLLNCVLPVLSSWLMAAQLASALSSPDYYNCQMQPGLTRRQRDICVRHPSAMRSISDGLRAAIDECHAQFERERWNCSATFSVGMSTKEDSTPETAFVFAISSGGASGAVAKACAQGEIADCGCGGGEQTVINSPDVEGLSGADPQQFIWAGCSDNIRFGNQFTRKFIDTAEKQRNDAKSLMNLHNNRVGRRLMAMNMRKKCKCHGVSGSCMTKTCWRAVPTMAEFAILLKQKYANAKQVTLAPDSALLVLNLPPSPAGQPLAAHATASRAERFLTAQSYQPHHFPPPQPSRTDLVFLERSPDYCMLQAENGQKVSGTSGRECFSQFECAELCCGRGWDTRHEVRQEPCRCKFVWCCDVKCDICRREIERRFCR
uniref:Protein Wnt n=1 Tax=Globodera rostochiensis TaxID=31243 RepID=A0A914HMT2_GLORO